MSIDFSTNPAQNMYAQSELDQSFSSIQGNDLNNSHPHSNGHMNMNGHSNDSLDMDHNYDIFSGNGANGLSSQRYRSNTTSSLNGSNYGLGVDPMYSQNSFNDSIPSFSHSNSHPYDLMSSLPSSYSSGKPSPLTPSDGLQNPSAFSFTNGHSKDFSQPSFSDPLLDRRLSGVISSDFPDEYSSMGVNSGLGLSAFQPGSSVQQFQDRLSRMPDQQRYPGPVIPPLSVPTHLNQGHGGDMMRGVAPQATHSFRPDDPVFDNMPSFLGNTGAPNPQADFALRLPSVDDHLARLRLQSGGDLQTFIRYVMAVLFRIRHQLTSGLLSMHIALIWTSMFGLLTDWLSARGRSSSCRPRWHRSRTGRRNG